MGRVPVLGDDALTLRVEDNEARGGIERKVGLEGEAKQMMRTVRALGRREG